MADDPYVSREEHARVVRKLKRTSDLLDEARRQLAGHARDLDGPPRLRDDHNRIASRLDAMTERPPDDGWRAGLARALGVPIDAVGRLTTGKVALLVVGVVLVFLIVTGQLSEVVAALVGTPVTEIDAPGSTVVAPDSKIDA